MTREFYCDDCGTGYTEHTRCRCEDRDALRYARMLGPVAVVGNTRDGRDTVMHSSDIPTREDLVKHGFVEPTVYAWHRGQWRDVTPEMAK